MARSNNGKEIASLWAAAGYYRGGHQIPAGMVFANGELIDLQEWLPETGPIVSGTFISA